MVVHLIFSIILFTNTVLNYRAAGCSTQGHFTNAKLEISIGNLSCADSNWGWPEIIIWDGAIVSKFELTTNDTHKNKLEEFKNRLGKINDAAIPAILKQLTIGEQLTLRDKVEYAVYRKFQVKYINSIEKLSAESKEKLGVFFTVK